jgi:thioredoxin 2
MSQSSIHVVCPHCGAVNRIPETRPAAQAKCGQCHRPLFEGKPVAAGAASFERHMKRGDLPLVVDFWAPWCAPCRAMAPAYERAAALLEPDYRLLKVNTEEDPELAASYQISSISTMMLFARGAPIAQTAGAMTATGIVDWVRAHGPKQQARAAAAPDEPPQRWGDAHGQKARRSRSGGAAARRAE